MIVDVALPVVGIEEALSYRVPVALEPVSVAKAPAEEAA